MIALIQRVRHASVSVEDEIVGQIDLGILALIGVQPDDTDRDVQRLCERILGYRIFSDEAGKMNRSVQDMNGGVLLVSQFTLAADTRKGMRPSFTSAAPPQLAKQRFDELVVTMRNHHNSVETGQFAADMQISLLNDGPVTFWLES